MSARPVRDVSAVVVSYHPGPTLDACLETLLADARVHEVQLVDNGNPDAVVDGLQDRALKEPRLQVISGHGNIGFAAGCNWGAQAASAPYLAFVNPDAVIDAGALDELMAALPETPGPHLVGGLVVGPDGVEQRGARRRALTLTRAARAFFARDREAHAVNLHRAPLPEGPVPMDAVSGAFCLIRAADFDALGGFDEGFFLHVEDVDLARRVWAAGGTVTFTPAARVRHVGATSDAPALKVAWWKGRSLARHFVKASENTGEKALAIALGPAIVTAALAQAVLRAHSRN